ncbi:hypothetical protein E5206_04105 [Arthrobacter sp. PAMC25564]|uniref:hypothetical protein n=1 Tax=Arthrobacter sp. PAMC25564 TaxID=2565366 RepID=UPI0010A26FC4|nr:hypothetical protein [Arthrobacter sp. PAMC25564]QCB96212.1 hypothetical protein E5206_04105 [Arthrobacter sp. PAMC25564]
MVTVNLGMWANFAIQSGLIAVLAASLFGAIAGFGLASIGRFSRTLGVAAGILVPVLGVAILAAVAVARRERRSGHDTALPWQWKSRSGIVSLASLAALTGVVAVTAFVDWFVVRIPGVSRISVGAWGTVLGGAVVVTIALMILGGLPLLRRPSRGSAILLAWVGSTWMFLAGVAVALRAPVVELASSLGALKFTVADALGALNLDAGAVGIDLPPTVDPAMLGLSGARVEPGAVDLAAPIQGLQFEIGPAWYCLLLFSAGLLLWSFLVVRQADRIARRPSPGGSGMDRQAAAGPEAPIPVRPLSWSQERSSDGSYWGTGN